MSLDFNVHARNDDLEIQELGDELLVYDRRTDVAHCLTPTATAVWRALGYRAALDVVVARFGAEAVEATVDELAAKGLLEAVDGIADAAPRISRRQAVRRLAVTAVAGATVVSVVAPPAAWALTCPASGSGIKAPSGCPCNGNGNCTSNTCSNGTCA